MTVVPRSRILVVDDDHALREALVKALDSMGYEAVGDGTPEKGLARLRAWEPDAAIFDLKMPGMDGVELTRQALLISPDLPILLLTGFGTIQGAVQAMREGVYDYLTKPFDLTEVDRVLKRALDHFRLRRRYRLLAEATGRASEVEAIIGEGPAVRELLNAISAVANTDSTVLVTGESGTGKELVARAVHGAGSRCQKPFVTVDCAAIPDTLLESELFGHVRGAFTGAHRERAGHFEVASDGTVFLDEIGEVPLQLQKTMLRVLQEKTFSRVGESRSRTTEARIVAATNRSLEREVKEGRFREDLFYRLRVIEIHLPPLRERSGDVPLLVAHYLGRLNRKLNRTVAGVSPEAMKLLRCYSWPGNVRELAHLLEQILTFHNPEFLDVVHLPGYLKAVDVEALPSGSYADLKEQTLERVGRRYFAALMDHYRGNITRVAEHAGINRRHLHRLLQKWGLDPAASRSVRDI
jgi:DNA-binding NtrC family response regulator